MVKDGVEASEQMRTQQNEKFVRMSKVVTAPSVVDSTQHPIHLPTLIKAVLSDFTPVMALFEGLFQSPSTQYTRGAALP
jgi:hypothetical protein